MTARCIFLLLEIERTSLCPLIILLSLLKLKYAILISKSLIVFFNFFLIYLKLLECKVQ